MISRAITYMIFMGKPPNKGKTKPKKPTKKSGPATQNISVTVPDEIPPNISVTVPDEIPPNIFNPAPCNMKQNEFNRESKKKKHGKNPLKKPMLKRAAQKKNIPTQNTQQSLNILSNNCVRKTNNLYDTYNVQNNITPIVEFESLSTSTNRHAPHSMIEVTQLPFEDNSWEYAFGYRIKHSARVLPLSIEPLQLEHDNFPPDYANAKIDNLLAQTKKNTKPMISIGSDIFQHDYSGVYDEHSNILQRRSTIHSKPLLLHEPDLEYPYNAENDFFGINSDSLFYTMSQNNKRNSHGIAFTPLNIYNGTLNNVPQDVKGQPLAINQQSPIILEDHSIHIQDIKFANRTKNIPKPLACTSNLDNNHVANMQSDQNMKDSILFTNVRDETHIIEWIAHHQNVGFTHIFIFDHLSKIPVESIVKHIPNVFVERINIELTNGVHLKQNLMQLALRYIAKPAGYKWMLYLDADEFLVLPKYNSIRDFLGAYPNAHQIGINWLCFGSNHMDSLDHGTILENFTKSDDCLNEHIKCFVRPEYVLNPYNPHVYTMKKWTLSCAIDHRKLNVSKPYFFPWSEDAFADVTIIDAYVAHYSHQDYATYIKRKCDLPRDDTGEMREVLSREEIHAKHNSIDNYVPRDLYNERNKELMEQWEKLIK